MSILTHDSHPATTGETRVHVQNAVLRTAKSIWQSLVAHRQASAHRLLVASLSDHQLADLGLTREHTNMRSFSDPNAV